MTTKIDIIVMTEDNFFINTFFANLQMFFFLLFFVFGQVSRVSNFKTLTFLQKNYRSIVYARQKTFYIP